MGLEPTTSTLQRSHSSQLSYAPVDDGMRPTSVHHATSRPVTGAADSVPGRAKAPGTTVTPSVLAPSRRPAWTIPAPSLLNGAPPRGAPTVGPLHEPRSDPMGTTEHDRLLDALAEGVRHSPTSDRWRAHLELQGRFHRYSFNNTLLIGPRTPRPPGSPGSPRGRSSADRSGRGSGPSGSWPRWSGRAAGTRRR